MKERGLRRTSGRSPRAPLALHFGAANEEAEARFLATPRRKHAAAEAEAKCLQRRP